MHQKNVTYVIIKERNAYYSPLFYYFKIIKIADKVIATNITIINYLQFLLIGLHFHQCLAITKIVW